MMTPIATMHPMMKIVFAPLTIAPLPLRVHIRANEPAATGKPRAMIMIFQDTTPFGPIGTVNPITISINPNNKDIPAPDKKLPWDSSCGCCSSLLSSITFT